MTSVTQKIRRFTGGISDQPDEQKLPGQVRDAVNCTPDVVYGLLKRPGTNTIEWSNGAPSPDGKWFWINKRNPATGPEKYVGQIDNETGKVRVWDLVTGTEQNVCYTSTIDLTSDFRGMTGTKNHPQDVCTLPGEGTDPAAANEPYFTQGDPTVDDLQVLTINDITFVTNRKVPVSTTGFCGNKTFPEGFIELRTLAGATEYNLRFFDVEESAPFVSEIVISNRSGTGDSSLTYPVTETITDDEGLQYRIVVSRYVDPEGQEFFTESVCLLEPGTGPYTLGQTFTAEVAGFTYTVRVAFLVESNSRSADPIIDATFTTPSSGVTTDGILDSLITQIDGVENFTAIKIGSGIYFTREQAFAVETTNGSLSRLLGPTQYEVGDETHFVATATTVSELPTQARDGMVALVGGSPDENEDDYYVIFRGDNAVDGPGIWEETVKPGIPTTFNYQSMPHGIVRSPNLHDPNDPNRLTFLVGAFEWYPREVGDEVTNPRPSFAPREGENFGRPINNLIFYRNRLAFLVDENVVMSKAGEYYNFWAKTATTISPDDPIDLQTASNYPSVLYNGIVNNTGLVVFSENNQFLVSTENDRLSPDTVKISQISNYNFNVNSNPVSLGTTIGFVGDQGKYTRFYEMANVRREGEPEVIEQSKVVERMVAASMNLVAVSKENDMVIMTKKGQRDVWLFRYFDTGERRQQSSWFRWEFPGSMVAHEVIFDSYYMVVENQGRVNLLRCDLRALSNPLTFTFDTEDYKNIEGDKYRIFLDYMVALTGTYDKTTRSTIFDPGDWFIFSGEKIMGVSLEENKGIPRSVNPQQGRLTEATVNDDGMLVLRGDWTSDPVVFGYNFEMKIVMPQFYMTKTINQNATESLDTANLIVHRVKTNLGQIGYYETTLKRLGRNDYTQIYEAKPMDLYKAGELGYMPDYEQTTPIYQRNTTFNLIIKSEHPSPAALYSATLEGVYTENYYKRA